MIKLYGVKPSNYYSLAKAILIEKSIPFEEIHQPPSQDEDYLGKSPMGKMPAIEVEGEYLSETLAIALWAERTHPAPALLPPEPMAAAKAMELTCHIKLDVELVARRLLPAAFFGATASDELKKSTRDDLVQGMKAVDRLFVADPYAAGAEFTLADLYVFYTFGLSSQIVKTVLEEDLLVGYPRIETLMASLKGRPSIARVELEKAA